MKYYLNEYFSLKFNWKKNTISINNFIYSKKIRNEILKQSDKIIVKKYRVEPNQLKQDLFLKGLWSERITMDMIAEYEYFLILYYTVKDNIDNNKSDNYVQFFNIYILIENNNKKWLFYL